MQSAVIVIKNLYFRYDKEYILENIDATIWEKEYIAIIGPNGGGKTTLLKLLLGLFEPTKGSIEIFGKSPKKARNLIGYLPQHINFNLDIPLLAREVILQGRVAPKKYRFNDQDLDAMQNIANRLHIEHLLDKKIGMLSGGERQRVLLARALVTDPKILLLDEPTAAVDIAAQKEIYALLQELPLTKIVVSHDINILLEGVSRVFYINRRLYIHDNVQLNIKAKDGHFCEMELFEELRRSCNA